MRFPLDKQQVVGFDYGVPTNYGEPHHLGVDWEADYVPLYAPKDGRVLALLNGPQGGLTIWFRPAGENIIIRWLHLSEFTCKMGDVKEGQQLAVTGNTGHSDLSHLHEDIWKNKVTLNFADTINPHDYYKENYMPKFFKINDHGKLGILILDGFTASGLLADDPDTYKNLLEAYPQITDQTATIEIP